MDTTLWALAVPKEATDDEATETSAPCPCPCTCGNADEAASCPAGLSVIEADGSPFGGDDGLSGNIEVCPSCARMQGLSGSGTDCNGREDDASAGSNRENGGPFCTEAASVSEFSSTTVLLPPTAVSS